MIFFLIINNEISCSEHEKRGCDFHHAKSDLKSVAIGGNDRRSPCALLQINPADF